MSHLSEIPEGENQQRHANFGQHSDDENDGIERGVCVHPRAQDGWEVGYTEAPPFRLHGVSLIVGSVIAHGGYDRS